MWGKKIIILFFCFILAITVFAQDTLAYWNFSETSGTTTKEYISNSNYSIHSKWPTIERVAGIRDNALRTDGYTVYVDGANTKTFSTDFVSFSMWIALETYPVNTAAIWSYFDPQINKGSFVAIDKFGRLVVTTTINGQLETVTSSQSIDQYRWNYVVVNIDAVNGSCSIYVNAVLVYNQSIAKGNLQWPSSAIYLGRSAITQLQDIFPLNYLNGIYDEIIVRKKLLTGSQITQEYNTLNPNTPPPLATPATRFAGDFHRPRYHAIPQSAWTNEPHGLIYYNGKYHLFFQKNGNGPFFSQQNWGHLTSDDLLSWNEVQPALFPQPGWESVGNWSGHAVVDDSGKVRIIYTGVDGVKAGIGSAQSNGQLLSWQKNLYNPLIANAPTTYPNRDFRDPYVFKEGNQWYMIIGSGLLSPSSGTVFLYKSNDLVSWQLVKPLFTDNSGSSGIFWEMPVFWKFGNRYMLLVNKTPQNATPARAFYWVGDFSNENYTVNNLQTKNLDIINSLLSPTVNYDAQNRVVAIGIIPDLLPGSEQYKQGWTHVFSLPRVWQMQNDSLFQSPHPDLDNTRGQLVSMPDIDLSSTSSNNLKVRGFQAEIRAKLQQGTATRVGFILEKNDNNSEYTRIYYDYINFAFVVDRTKSSANANTPRDIQTEYFPMPAGQPIDWHIYIDGSVIEVFINNKWAFATRAFPASSNSNIIDVFAEGGSASVKDIKIWNRGNLDVITALNDPGSDTNSLLKVWPVPANGKCNIQLPTALSGEVSVAIYDGNGRLVQNTKQHSINAGRLIELDFSDGIAKRILSGTYYCTLSNRKREYKTKIMIVR